MSEDDRDIVDALTASVTQADPASPSEAVGGANPTTDNPVGVVQTRLDILGAIIQQITVHT